MDARAQGLDPVVVGAVRTPVGRRNGGLAGVHAVDLGAVVLRALVERSGIDPMQVDDVIMGCVSQVGESGKVARKPGWPRDDREVPATTIDGSAAVQQGAVRRPGRHGRRIPAGVAAGRAHDPGPMGST